MRGHHRVGGEKPLDAAEAEGSEVGWWTLRPERQAGKFSLEI